jgi:hypothetical protein
MIKKLNSFYLINSLKERGAELGMELILNNGFLKNYNIYVIVLGKIGNDLEKRISKKYNLIFLENKNFSNFKLIYYLYLLQKLIIKFKPKIVISSLNQSVILSRILKIFNNFFLLNFEHSTKFNTFGIYTLIKFSDFLCDLFLVDSSQTGKFLNRRRKKNKKIILPLFYFTRNAKPKIRKKIIYCVGHFTQVKNYLNILKTVHYSKILNKGYLLKFFGEGETLLQLQKYINKNNLSKRVKIMDNIRKWQSHVGLGSIYISFSDYEGLSISTLEAMEVGSCCLVRPVGEIKNYINTANGVIIKSYNSIAKSLNKIDCGKLNQIEIGKNAREYTRDHYSRYLFSKKLKFINNIIDKNDI